jgi:hypothetical protein
LDAGRPRRLSPQPDSPESGRSKFIQSERFSGPLIGLLTKTLAATERGFERMNEALKRRVEAMH